MSRDTTTISDNKMVYQISLNSKSLGLINPYLFVEKLRDEIINRLPSIKVRIVYHTKVERDEQALVELNCFLSHHLPNYKLSNIKEEISFIAASVQDDLNNRIEDARRSVA